jgi:hypothetical protein
MLASLIASGGRCANAQGITFNNTDDDLSLAGKFIARLEKLHQQHMKGSMGKVCNHRLITHALHPSTVTPSRKLEFRVQHLTESNQCPLGFFLYALKNSCAMLRVNVALLSSVLKAG